MNGRWLIIAAIAGGAVSARAADVQFFGIHVPELGKWAVYGRISNSTSTSTTPGITAVTGFSSIDATVLNNGGNTVTGVANYLPYGTTSKTDVLQDNPDPQQPPTPEPVGYGFWIARDASLINGGAHVQGAQYTFFTSANAAVFNKFVLQGPGLAAGSQPVDNANFITSSTSWLHPLPIAQGTYTAGANNSVGLTISSPSANLLRDADTTATVNWSGPGKVEVPVNQIVTDPRYVTGVLTGTAVGGTSGTTYKAGLGDATLDGQVNLDDLVTLANHYGTSGTWFDGDFTLDGQINLDDLVALANHYGTAVPGSVPVDFAADVQKAFGSAIQVTPVPEPAVSGVLAVGAAWAGLRRRRRLRETLANAGTGRF